MAGILLDIQMKYGICEICRNGFRQEDLMTLQDMYSGDILQETARILRTQPEHINNTIKRFLKDIESYKKKN